MTFHDTGHTVASIVNWKTATLRDTPHAPHAVTPAFKKKKKKKNEYNFATPRFLFSVVCPHAR